VPLYEKTHSYGEYVFDWAWAEAYQRYGLVLLPKWLAAVPFTPVEGSRLIAGDPRARERLADELLAHARAFGDSSLHVLLARGHRSNCSRAAACWCAAACSFTGAMPAIQASTSFSPPCAAEAQEDSG